MAFSINCVLSDMEFRALQTGTSSQNNRTWMSLVFEDAEANQVSVSVPSDMQSDVYALALRRGDLCTIAIRAVARADGNSYVQLRAVPELLEEDE